MFFLVVLLYCVPGTIRATPVTNIFVRDVLPIAADALACICPAKERAVTDIVWSCLATIFACAWVAVHPNIPAPEELPDPDEVLGTGNSDMYEITVPWRRLPFRQWGRKFKVQAFFVLWRWAPAQLKHTKATIIARCHRVLPRLELMVWSLLAPECMVFWAMRQWYGVRQIQKEMDGLYPNWTNTHGHFLQMGGFVLFDGDVRIRILDLRNLCSLMREKDIQDFQLTQADIEDHSKGDALSKAVALGQTMWFVAQCLTRSATNLATTELELVTLAFATLNAFMYFFWWDKPLDVRMPVRVYLKSDLDPTDKARVLEYLSVIDQEPSRTSPVRLYQWPLYAMKSICERLNDMCIVFTSPESEKIRPEATRVHIFYAQPLKVVQAEVMQCIASFIAAIFGAIHCAAWNFAFPTRAETVLWHIFSPIVATGPLVLELHMVFYKPEDKYSVPMTVETTHVLYIPIMILWLSTVYTIVPLYFIARVVLLVVAVLSLRDLPPSALAIVQWSTLLPHI